MKRRVPGAKICKPSSKTKQLAKKEQERAALEQRAAEAQLRRPLDYDKMTRANIGRILMGEIDAAPSGSKAKKCMLFMLLDRIRAMRAAGPAFYEK